MEHKDSMESDQNICHTMDLKQNQKDQIVYWTFSERKEFQSPYLNDNSKMQTEKLWIEYLRRFWVNDKTIEAHRPNQNPFEREFHIHKEMLDMLFITTGCSSKGLVQSSMSHCRCQKLHCNQESQLQNTI